MALTANCWLSRFVQSSKDGSQILIHNVCKNHTNRQSVLNVGCLAYIWCQISQGFKLIFIPVYLFHKNDSVVKTMPEPSQMGLSLNCKFYWIVLCVLFCLYVWIACIHLQKTMWDERKLVIINITKELNNKNYSLYNILLLK